jgi:hypothetical protein
MRIKATLLGGLLLTLPFITYAAQDDYTINVNLDATQLSADCLNNTLVLAKGKYPGQTGGSLVLKYAPLCDYKGKLTQIASYHTSDFTHYLYLLVSDRYLSSLIVKGNCSIANFKQNTTVTIAVTENSSSEPTYTVSCNY